jgi:transposase InsO family protein
LPAISRRTTEKAVAQQYNPIVRIFGRFRAGLLDSLGVDRRAVRPDTPLEELIPAHERREVWRRLRRQGLRVPALELTRAERAWNLFGVLKTTASLALGLQRWPALLAALPLGLLAYWASRRRAVHFPLGLRTVGEMVLYLTSFPEHKGSGYRWTHNEIAFKVRLVVAESLGLTLDAVRPESTFAELGAE